jgi:hypothetical protein
LFIALLPSDIVGSNNKNTPKEIAMRLTAALLGLLLVSDLHASEDKFLGKWALTSGSFEIPKTCKNLWYSFSAEGELRSGDGSLEELKSYTIEEHKKGFRLNTQYVSNNGQKNCQNFEAAYVQENSLGTFYVEFFDDGDALKLFFDSEPGETYLLFKKQ